MPGIVEFLPAMPDSLMEGSIEGVWLYTFAKLNCMSWTKSGLKASLTSGTAQTLTLRCRRPGCRILVNGQELAKDGDHTTRAFAEGETAEIEILF